MASVPDVHATAADMSLRYLELNRRINADYGRFGERFQAIIDPAFAGAGASDTYPGWFAFAAFASRGIGQAQLGAEIALESARFYRESGDHRTTLSRLASPRLAHAAAGLIERFADEQALPPLRRGGAPRACTPRVLHAIVSTGGIADPRGGRRVPGALDGVRVIDLTAVLLGPFATQHLADMGADVIKVEPPEGDLLRASGGAMGRDTRMGPIYMAANRNKRSICLDLKKPSAVAVLKGMAEHADLFIHNSRPQAIERLGLGYEDLRKINRSIVYAYSLGYARRGPYGHKPAFDDLVQGVSGAASLQSRVDGLPPRFIPSLIADKTTGLHLAIAVLGALYHRQRTGEGQLIEVPMFETMASFWLTEHLFGATWRPTRGEMGYDRIINKFRHPFPTKDGYLCALPYTDQHWITFFELAGRPDLAREKKFIDRLERAKHFSELYQVLDSLLKDRTTAEWLEVLDRADIPAMPVLTIEDLMEDPHLRATGFFSEREHPTEGPIVTVASPLNFEKTTTSFRRHAPRVGEDGVEVLREAGFSDAQIEALKAEGALVLP